MNHRLRNHLGLAALSVGGAVVAAAAGNEATAPDRVSIVTAYQCLLLLAVALLIGPWQSRRTGRPVLNSHLRRDIGIWAGLTGLAHFWLGNQLSMNFEYLGVWVNDPNLTPGPAVREELYMWGTIAGYVVAVLILLLLALSSDRMLKWAGAKWWKRLQRSAYAMFVLTVAHAFIFQVIESRAWLWVAVVTVTALVVAGYRFAARRAATR